MTRNHFTSDKGSGVQQTDKNRVKYKGIQIVAAPENDPPFDVKGIAAEQDTYLIMNTAGKIAYPSESPGELVRQMCETLPVEPGTVLVVRGKHAFRFLAIVHDVSKTPTWREEWIETALDAIFYESEARRISAIGLPFLGTLYGTLNKNRFLVMLRTAINRASLIHLKRLWLIVPDEKSEVRDQD